MKVTDNMLKFRCNGINDKNNNTKQNIILGIIILFLMAKIIFLAISVCDLQTFASCTFVLTGSFAILFAFPRIEAILHEFGHLFSIVIIAIFLRLRVYPKISSETTDSGSTVLKTTSNIDDILRKNKMYSFIRFYSLSGIIVVTLFLIALYKLLYGINILIDNAIIGSVCAITYHELFSLCSRRKTNDFNIFIHPELF